MDKNTQEKALIIRIIINLSTKKKSLHIYLQVPTSESLAFNDLLITHTQTVNHTYRGTVHSGLEPMTGMSYELTTVARTGSNHDSTM